MYENNKDIGWKKKNNSSNGSYDDSLIKNQINVLDNKIEEEIKNVNSQLAHKANKSFVDVRDFGAKGDGITNDTASIQNALDSIKETGGVVRLVTGRYVIDSLNIHRGCSLEGDYCFDNKELKGTILYCISNNENAIKLYGANLIENVSFYYPNQFWDNLNSRPGIIYPSCITIVDGAQRITLQNLLFINPTTAMDFSLNHEYIVCTNIQGYAIQKGLIVDNCSDIDRFKTIHFNYNTINRYGLVDNAEEFAKWTRNNGTAFDLKRCDWGVFDDIFCWSYQIGVRIVQGSSGKPTHGLRIVNSGFDACRNCAVVENAKYVTFNNCLFTAFYHWGDDATKESAAINVSSGNSVTITNSNFWGCSKECVKMNVDRAIISSCGFFEYGKKSSTYNSDTRCILLGVGNYIISNNYFVGFNLPKVYGILASFENGKETNSLLLSGNTFERFTTTLLSSLTPIFYEKSGNMFVDCSHSTLDVVTKK